MSIESGKNIGMVIGGSLSQGTDVKLNPSTSVEDIKSGQFLTIEGKDGKFFGVVTDVSLENTDSSVFSQMTFLENKEVVNALKGTVAYGKVSLSTNLILPTGIDSIKTIEPAKNAY